MFTRTALAHLCIVALVTAASTGFFLLAGVSPVAGLVAGLFVHGVLIVTGR